MTDRTLGLLGMAMRAGKVASGEKMTLDAIRSGKAQLVLVARDSSDNTRKLFRDKCAYYKVVHAEYGTREILGHALGRAGRSSVAVMDGGFARALLERPEIQEAVNAK